MMKWILLPFEGFFDENDDKHGDDENALLSFFLYPLWGPRGPPAWAAWQLEAHWAPKEDPPPSPEQPRDGLTLETWSAAEVPWSMLVC